MHQYDTGILPVVQDSPDLKLVGVVTDRDLCLTVGLPRAATRRTGIESRQSGSVQQIFIQDGSNPAVTLARQGGNWRLLQPYPYAADNGEVSTLLSTLSGVHPSEQLGP